MLVRPFYHWLSLTQGLFWLLLAAFVFFFKPDHFLLPFYFAFGAFMLVFWSNCFDVLTDESIDRRRLFYTRHIPLEEIVAIEPHRKNGQWSYGKVFIVIERSGRRTNFQSTHADEWLHKIGHRFPQLVVETRGLK